LHDDEKPEERPGLRRIRPALTVFGALLIGALGSGLWELFLRDLLLALGNSVLSLVARIWGGYVDVLHQQIGNSHPDLLVVPIFAIVVFGVLMTPWFLLAKVIRLLGDAERAIAGEGRRSRRTEEQATATLRRLKRHVFRVLIPLSVLVTATFSVQIWHTSYTRNAANWVSRSIEILAPNLTPERVLRFRSDLRQVNTAKQFFKLEDELRNTAKDSSIELPSFQAIGRSGA